MAPLSQKKRAHTYHRHKLGIKHLMRTHGLCSYTWMLVYAVFIYVDACVSCTCARTGCVHICGCLCMLYMCTPAVYMHACLFCILPSSRCLYSFPVPQPGLKRPPYALLTKNASSIYCRFSCVPSCSLSLSPRPVSCMHIYRVGQNRIYTYIYTVYLVISKPKIPYVHRIYMVLAKPTHLRNTIMEALLALR